MVAGNIWLEKLAVSNRFRLRRMLIEHSALTYNVRECVTDAFASIQHPFFDLVPVRSGLLALRVLSSATSPVKLVQQERL